MTIRSYTKPSEAALAADVTHRSLNNWCRRYPGLARKVGGRWRIDPAAFDRLIRGESIGKGANHESAI
jgi:hypothetical protein